MKGRALNRDFIVCIVAWSHKRGKEVVKLAVKKKALAQLALLLMGGAFILYGALRGEAGIVLAKAIKICLECVGIG